MEGKEKGVGKKLNLKPKLTQFYFRNDQATTNLSVEMVVTGCVLQGLGWRRWGCGRGEVGGDRQ